MKARTWDDLWQGADSRSLWAAPDEGVVGLVPMLRGQGVRRVLDLGCGIGRHLVLLARSGFETYGMDSSQRGIEHCRSLLTDQGLEADLSSGEMKSLAYRDSVFDFVLSWNVIYHGTWQEMTSVLKEVHRVLQSRGLFYLTLNSTRNSWCGKGTEVEPNTFGNPEKGDGQHLHHFSDEDDLTDLMSDWDIENMEESEQAFSGNRQQGSWHWTILARKKDSHITTA